MNIDFPLEKENVSTKLLVKADAGEFYQYRVFSNEKFCVSFHSYQVSEKQMLSCAFEKPCFVFALTHTVLIHWPCSKEVKIPVRTFNVFRCTPQLQLELQPDQSYRFCFIEFEPDFLQSFDIAELNLFLAGEKGKDAFRTTAAGMNPQLLAMIREMRTCVYQNKARVLYFQSKVNELLLHISELLANPAKRYQSFVITDDHRQKILDAMPLMLKHIHLPHPPREIAGLAGLTNWRYIKGFSRVTGVTLEKWVEQARMEKARKLLAETELKVADIAGQVGFTGISPFCTAFLRVNGVSPGAYRGSAKLTEPK